VPKQWADALEVSLENGRPEPYGKNSQLIYIMLNPPVETVSLRDDVDYQSLLDKAVNDTNHKMIGILTGKEIHIRRIVTLVVLLLILCLFIFVFQQVFGSMSRIYQTKAGVGRGYLLKKYMVAYLLLIPAVVSIAIWSYYPMIKGAVMSFQEYRVVTGTKWVGLANFSEVVFSVDYWKSLLTTCYYVGLFLCLGFFSPIILAVMLHEVPRGKIIYRILYYLPAVTSGLVIMFLWRGFYDPTPVGFLNRLIGIFNIPPQNWLGNPRLAMPCVVLPTIWANVGPGCIVYLAALKSIPEELYDAADVDGTNMWQKFVNITLSYLKPLLIINFVGVFIGAFQSADYILAMTGGGPLRSTHVAGLEIWYEAFVYQRFGTAVSMAWIMSSFLIGFTIYNLKILSQVEFRKAEV
jgi:multiple sugar transport system permease protein